MRGDEPCKAGGVGLRYSTDWLAGGPIIEREKITLEWTGEDWMAYIRHDEEFFGPTPLIAAMRCYVASKLGDEVDVPGELLGDDEPPEPEYPSKPTLA